MMRFRILSLFVTIQVISFIIWNTLSYAETSLEQMTRNLPSHPAPAVPTVVVEQIIEEPEQSPEHVVHFSSLNMSEKGFYVNEIKKNQLTTALSALPFDHARTVENITIDYSPEIRRGMGGNNKIILRGINMSVPEMIAVMVHELGHNVDYAYLTPSEQLTESGFVDGSMPLYESDASLNFYRINWKSETRRKTDAVNTDFVSGYAMTDCFEDFAESYTYYVLHNKDFKRLATTSEALYAKYYFMKYEVFDGMEFDTGDGLVSVEDRPWDITALDYNFTEFLS
ncbi:hypothetical protein JXD20_02210 [Candidatus Peregrinibacteria bacterium]|nr:hypothetical protein [Candidatus Peregrinibacteria bacterium]